MLSATEYGVPVAERAKGDHATGAKRDHAKRDRARRHGAALVATAVIAVATLALLLISGSPLTAMGGGHQEFRPMPHSDRVCPLDVIASESPPPSHDDCFDAWMWWRRYLATFPRVPM